MIFRTVVEVPKFRTMDCHLVQVYDQPDLRRGLYSLIPWPEFHNAISYSGIAGEQEDPCKKRVG